jgi:hypothetical protein
MSEPPVDGGAGQPAAGDPGDPSSPDYSSPDYNGAPDGAGDDGPRRTGAHRAGGRPTPPPPPPAGAPYWPQPDYQPDDPVKRPLIDTLPVMLLKGGAAVVVVAVLLFVFYQVFGGNTTSNDAKPVATHTSATVTKAGSPASGTSGTSAPTTTTAPTKTSAPGKTTTPGKTTAPTKTKAPTKTATPAKTTAKPTSKPTATAKPTTPPPPPVNVKAPLLVLNNSRIHGLALTGKATFERGGWTVLGTGNFSGRLPQTTVYYSPGFKAAAQTLARQFPTVTTVLPRTSAVPGSAPLTVVLTRYFKP